MVERVLMLHGLWMRSFAMGLLQHWLSEAGFQVEQFEYADLAAEDILAALRRRLASRGDGMTVHVVGHSLGGLIALRALAAPVTGLAPGRIVCLGSPLLGSAAARGLAQFGGEALLGAGKELLEYGLVRWDGEREVGVIAGRMRLGLGAVLGQLQGDHDGSVAVVETQLPGIAAHCVVEASHTGLLMSPETARQSAHFLRHGVFTPSLR